jgi:hypothetical protein
MDIEKNLFRKTASEYGDTYADHYLEIYKLYVDMADRISNRRQSANSFFLTVNTAIIAIVTYIQWGTYSYWIVSLAGMAVCYFWYRLIKSYKDMNSGKFKVIHVIEQRLPLSIYDAEWEALGRGKDSKRYLPFTSIENKVPWIFFVLHFIVFLKAILSYLFFF